MKYILTLLTRPCFKCFTESFHLLSPNHCELGAVIMSILRIKELRLREVKQFMQDRMVSKWQSQN